jgi:hypothetical protein
MTKGISDYVTLHELGHGLTATPGDPGSPHAGSLRCFEGATPVTYSASCTEDETGDPFDPMGLGTRDVPAGEGAKIRVPLEMTAWRKLNFGAIPASDAPTVAYSGIYTISPLEQNDGVRLLRIPSGDGRFLDLDFRQRIGYFDQSYQPGEPAVSGVAIHLDDPSFRGGHPSLLLDTTPATESFDDAPLLPGQRFANFRNGIVVETLSAGPSGATVKITGLPEQPAVTRRKAGGCKVPSLRSKRLKAARKSIRKRGCKVGKVKLRPSKKVPKGKVVSQRSRAGKILKAGATVNVVVSSGPPKGR